MSAQVDLKEIEKNAFKSNFEDGLWDIYLGLLLLLMGFGPIFDMVQVPESWETLLFLLFVGGTLAAFIAMKKFVIAPRLGLVTFSAERKRKKTKVALVLSLSVLLGVVMYLVAVFWEQGSLNPFGDNRWLLPAGLFFVQSVIVFSVMAYYLDYTRAYLYGWLFGLSFGLNIALSELYGISWPVFTYLSAGIMIGIGLVLFIQFMRSHPVVVNEVNRYGE